METQKKNYVLPIAMMFALFAMISFVTGLQNPMGIIVKNQFGASNFMSQLGNAANFIAYAFMGLPAGLMLQRIGYKKTALAAVAVGFIGVGISYLSGLMSSFSVYLIGAFVSGFSMCMLNTVVNPMLNTLVVCAMLCPVSAVVSMPVFQSDISFGMAQVPVSIMLLVLCGLCTSVMWGGIFNLAVEGLGKYTSAASGIFMVMVCGGGILPLIQGLVADHAGYMMSFWVVFAGVLYILYYALAGHRNVNTDIKVD